MKTENIWCAGVRPLCVYVDLSVQGDDGDGDDDADADANADSEGDVDGIEGDRKKNDDEDEVGVILDYRSSYVMSYLFYAGVLLPGHGYESGRSERTETTTKKKSIFPPGLLPFSILFLCAAFLFQRSVLTNYGMYPTNS